ncbi:AAA family ATPase [Bradyrhizobium sp. LMTR 3]|uniref:AAA family ATPase n=1 Tax=Bradyrhizobium sp. LMTR 3 TaxID=189873 RepID=UPI00159F2A8E|nr:AAA family ATPase [Bradyrhizobium sp. LMTR 3]
MRVPIPPAEGQRHNHAEYEDADFAKVLPEEAINGPDQFDDADHETVFRSADSVKGSGEAAPLSQQSRIIFTKFSDIVLSTTSRYLLKGILPSVGLVVVWGPPKCGKSFFVFDMVAHIAAGWRYRDRRVKQCPVVYFALEGQLGFEARVEAFRKAHSISDIPFYLSTDRIVLPHDGEAVVASIKRQFPTLHPGIIVLDTLNRSMAGSENDPSDMAAYIRAADLIRETFNCLVIVIHHCGVEKGRPRGHTSLTGAADGQIAVSRDAFGNVVALVEYMKDGPQGDQIASALEQVTVGTDEDGDPVISCVIRSSEMAASSRAKVSGQAALALRVLQDTIADNYEEPPPAVSALAKTRTCREELWRANFYKKTASEGGSQTSQQKAFVRAANKLLELKLIEKWGNSVWLA